MPCFGCFVDLGFGFGVIVWRCYRCLILVLKLGLCTFWCFLFCVYCEMDLLGLPFWAVLLSMFDVCNFVCFCLELNGSLGILCASAWILGICAFATAWCVAAGIVF